MKVTQITAYYPPHLGGMENYIENLSMHLVSAGHEVLVLTSDQGKPTSLPRDSAGLRVKYLKSIEVAHTPIFPSLIWELFKQPPESIFHLHVSQAYIPEIVMLVAKLKGIPYVAHLHLDVDPSGKFGFLLKPYKSTILKLVLKHANKIICLTENQKQEFIQKYGLNPQQIEIVPNAVTTNFFIKRPIPSPQLNLLYVGRLVSQKRVSLLIEAVKLLKHRVILHLVGDGEDRINLLKLCQSLQLQSVIFHGQLSGQKLLDQYRNATIFVMASKREGFSLSLLEAMAAGVPIVAVNSPGVRDLVNSIGVLTPPTPADLAFAIDQLLAQPLRLHAISQAEISLAHQYTWPKLINSIALIYENLQ
jgi:glycosyltransferase involved in cell wall biosynthesis